MNVRDRTVCRAFSQATIVYFDLQRCSIEWQYKRASIMDPLFSLILENRDSTTECTANPWLRPTAVPWKVNAFSNTPYSFFFLKRYFRKHPYLHSSFPFNKQCYYCVLHRADVRLMKVTMNSRERHLLWFEIDEWNRQCHSPEIDISISFLGRETREGELKSMLT